MHSCIQGRRNAICESQIVLVSHNAVVYPLSVLFIFGIPDGRGSAFEHVSLFSAGGRTSSGDWLSYGPRPLPGRSPRDGANNVSLADSVLQSSKDSGCAGVSALGRSAQGHIPDIDMHEVQKIILLEFRLKP